MATVISDKSKPLWRWTTSGIALALGAAFFTALTYLSDTYVTHNVLPQNGWTGTLVYLTLGGWVGVISNLIYNRLMGKTLDITFKGETLLKGKSFWYVVIAGILSAISTGAYLSVAVKGDPSIIIALLNFSIVYLVVYDSWKTRGKQNWLRDLGIKLLWAFVVMVGASLASVKTPDFWNGFEATLETLILLMGISAGTSAIGYVFVDKALKEEYENPVNVAFWRFLFLAIAGTVLSVATAWGMNILPNYFALLQSIWWIALPFIVVTMIFAYANNTLGIVAQNYDKASTVLIIKTASVAFALPLTLLAFVWMPGKFEIPTDSAVIAIRIIGTILIFIGIGAVLIIRAKESRRNISFTASG